MLYSSTMSQSKYTKELTDLLRLLYYNHYHDTEFEEILTLEAAKRLHINNTKSINLLESKHIWVMSTNFGLISLLLIIIILILTKFLTKPREDAAVINSPSIHISVPEVSVVLESKEVPRISQLPYF